jgi:hypothetical protein
MKSKCLWLRGKNREWYSECCGAKRMHIMQEGPVEINCSYCHREIELGVKPIETEEEKK